MKRAHASAMSKKGVLLKIGNLVLISILTATISNGLIPNANAATSKVYFKSDFTIPKTNFPAYTILSSSCASTTWYGKYPPELGHWHCMDVRYGTNTIIPDPAYNDPGKLCLQAKLLTGYSDKSAKLSELQWLEPANYAGEWANSKEGWFNFKVWLPSDFTVKGWRMLWQDYGNPIGTTGGPQMALYCYHSIGFTLELKSWTTKTGLIRQFPFLATSLFPKNQWVSVSIYVKQGTGFKVPNGTVQIWINGKEVFNRSDLETGTANSSPYIAWSICNYGGSAELAGQRILFKNVNVASARTP